MSKLLDKAFDKIRTLPDDRQNQIGAWLIDVVDQDHSDVQLTPAQQKEVRHRIADPEQPLSEDETEAFFNKIA